MKENEPKFIGDSSAFKMQKYQWWNIPPDKKLKFEIINWRKIKNVEHRSSSLRPTYYCRFCAYLHKDVANSIKGDIVIMDIPYLTFERAIESVGRNIKRIIFGIDNEDNVYIEMIKHSKSKIEITDMQRRVEDVNMTTEAKELLYDYNT